jgi:hypothetical protein
MKFKSPAVERTLTRPSQSGAGGISREAAELATVVSHNII